MRKNISRYEIVYAVPNLVIKIRRSVIDAFTTLIRKVENKVDSHLNKCSEWYSANFLSSSLLIYYGDSTSADDFDRYNTI